mmetsp:Transcript_19733/g.45325  ORF Transcript_19733/g.45325 Transcript_19733/m.45325 type:complete len:118 (+) Transcript_19733:23-376(+)
MHTRSKCLKCSRARLVRLVLAIFLLQSQLVWNLKPTPDEEAIRPMWTEESGLARRIMKMESLDRKNAAAEGVCMMPPTIGHQNTVRLNEHIEELELQVGIRARASFLSSGLHTDHRD